MTCRVSVTLLDVLVNDHTGDAFNSPYLLDLRPYSEFNNEAAKNKLLNLRIDHDNGPQIVFVVPGDVHAIDESNPDDEDGFAWRQSQFLRLSGWINLESSLSVKFLASWLDCYANSSEVGCAGAVLSHLQRRRAARYLPGDGAAQLFFRVSTIEMFTLKETMLICYPIGELIKTANITKGSSIQIPWSLYRSCNPSHTHTHTTKDRRRRDPRKDYRYTDSFITSHELRRVSTYSDSISCDRASTWT